MLDKIQSATLVSVTVQYRSSTCTHGTDPDSITSSVCAPAKDHLELPSRLQMVTWAININIQAACQCTGQASAWAPPAMSMHLWHILETWLLFLPRCPQIGAGVTVNYVILPPECLLSWESLADCLKIMTVCGVQILDSVPYYVRLLFYIDTSNARIAAWRTT